MIKARERLAHEMDAIAEERAELNAQEGRTQQAGEAETKRLQKARDGAERAYRTPGG